MKRRTKDEQKTVRAARADKEKTKKISSPQPSPKERECSNGKVRRRNDEQKTNNERTKDEQRTNKRRTKDEQWTNKRRTKDEQMTNKRRTKDEQRTNKERCEPHGQMEKERTNDGANRTDRWGKDEENILTPVTYSSIRRLLPRRGSVVTDKWDEGMTNKERTKNGASRTDR